MNEKVTALGSIIFVFGALVNLSAIGAAATGNVPLASSYFSPGLALELVAFVILGVGVLTKGKPRTPSHEQKTPISKPIHDST